MLTLSPEQTAALAELVRQRDLALLAAALGEAFPDVPQRLGDRLPALVALAVQRAQAQGLQHLLFSGRQLACWVALGADFESRPGGEWAATLLADTTRTPASRIHALCRRTRDLLHTEPQHGRPTPAMFDAALVVFDRHLQAAGDLAALGPRHAVRVGQPCDLDAIEIQALPAAWRQHYTAAGGSWQRVPVAGALPGISLRADGAAPWPAQISLLSPAPGREGPALLRVRTHAAHCCDPQDHPLVTLGTVGGPRSWRGLLAADITWPLPAAAAAPEAIAAEGSPTLHPVLFSSCGLRDSGAPVGDLKTTLAVYPAEQHLLDWHRAPLLPMQLMAGAAPLPTFSTLSTFSTFSTPSTLPRCRLERDGVALPHARWVAGLQALDAQIGAGMARLLAAWGRDSGSSATALDAEISLLTGAAGLSWGWSHSPAGLSAPPYMRVVGLFQDLACRVQLALTGRLALEGSQSVLTLSARCAGMLPASLQRGADDADLGALLQPLQLSLLVPFELELTPVADPGLATLSVSAPPSGALLLQAGLRARPDGPGLQWYAKLGVEAVRMQGVLHDPLLGQWHLSRPLLPAMTLVDWSL